MAGPLCTCGSFKTTAEIVMDEAGNNMRVLILIQPEMLSSAYGLVGSGMWEPIID